MADTKKYMPNAVKSLRKTYYVAQGHPKASDSNPGTVEFPFKTITKAGSVLKRADWVVIDEGTYREEVQIFEHGHRYVPETKVVFEAAPGKEVYWKGSDVFEADWEPLPGGLHKAPLPEWLFEEGVYNPYELSGEIDESKTVRPCADGVLPETFGQIYVEGQALEQLTCLEAVRETAGSFIVTADGRDIVVHFTEEVVPNGKLIELTVRKRCLAPQFDEPPILEAMGMVIEHAAEPGPFCFSRPLTIRRNPGTGITVRKTPVTRDAVRCDGLYAVSYLSKYKPTLISTQRVRPEDADPLEGGFVTSTSNDGGRTWQVEEYHSVESYSPYQYFLDEANGMLLRHYCQYEQFDEEAAYGALQHDVMVQISQDEGKSWLPPERVDSGTMDYGIKRLADGTLLWPYNRNESELGGWFAPMGTRLGKWRKDLSGIDWTEGGSLAIGPEKSIQGLDEPHVCQFPDGRLFVIFRQCYVQPSQHSPGFPAVKLFSVSEDGGRSWQEARPLTYEDGSYVYSPSSWPDVICSSKNGRVYVVINIHPNSAMLTSQDPRWPVNVAELDTDTVSVKRDTVAIVEDRHPEHHPLLRLSNWRMMEDRYTGNALLFMTLGLMDWCPIRKGYDLNCHRYEIEFPG